MIEGLKCGLFSEQVLDERVRASRSATRICDLSRGSKCHKEYDRLCIARIGNNFAQKSANKAIYSNLKRRV